MYEPHATVRARHLQPHDVVIFPGHLAHLGKVVIESAVLDDPETVRIESDAPHVVTLNADEIVSHLGYDFGDSAVILPTKYVNVYRVERCYGGPEEGGWWYDAGEPIESRLVGPNEDLDSMVAVMRARHPRTDKRFSVNGGEDYDVVVEEHFATPYPSVRPHYE